MNNKRNKKKQKRGFYKYRRACVKCREEYGTDYEGGNKICPNCERKLRINAKESNENGN